MQSYAVTSLVGGSTPGSYSSDVYYMANDGRFVLSDSARSVLNTTHPIHQIAVFSGYIIDGLAITYNIEDEGTTTISHGSPFDTPTSVVSFGENEVLAAVYGRAGYFNTYYDQNLIGSIAFVIFDTETEESRTAGPFGNADGNIPGHGQPFWVSDVLAFGSFGQDTSTVGLSGLMFFKNPSSNSTDTTLIPGSLSSID